MQKITTHLWFDKEAKEAALFYTSLFPSSKIKNIQTLSGSPSGDVDIVSLNLYGVDFQFISAGPYFKINPSISFLVELDTKEEVDALWSKLIEGGSALMALDTYPWSGRYGWLNDKYGVSWQIMFAGPQKMSERITPVMMFVGDVCGKAEEAINFYASVFHNSKVGAFMRYDANEDPDKEGTVKWGNFTLEGKGFAAMDSARTHGFNFSEATSFIVNCETQKEIDYYWEKLSFVPESEQCGWLKDKYGVSWQIVPSIMNDLLKGDDKEKIARVTEAFLKMKKFDIAELARVAEGK